MPASPGKFTHEMCFSLQLQVEHGSHGLDSSVVKLELATLS